MTGVQYTDEALAEINRRLAELEPLVGDDVKRATAILIKQYAEALHELASR